MGESLQLTVPYLFADLLNNNYVKTDIVSGEEESQRSPAVILHSSIIHIVTYLLPFSNFVTTPGVYTCDTICEEYNYRVQGNRYFSQHKSLTSGKINLVSNNKYIFFFCFGFLTFAPIDVLMWRQQRDACALPHF